MSLRIQSKQITPPVNLLSSPEDLTTASWHSPNLTILSNTELAPDGTFTASKFTYLTPGAFVYQDSIASMTAGETYTISVYAKVSGPALLYGYNGIGIICSGGTAFANYGLDGSGYTFPGRQGVMNMTIEPAAHGFYRIAYTFVAMSSPDISFWLSGYNGSDWTGNTMTLWGAQLVHRPNLLTYTSDFNHAPWDLANIDVTSDTTTAPDGTMTADTLTARNQDPYLGQWVDVIAGVTYTASVYVKAGSANSVGAQGFIWSWFTSDPGAATGPANYAQVLHTLSNDWQHTYITFTPYTSGRAIIRVDTMERNWTYAPGDFTYMWGASLTVADDIPYYPQRQLNSGVRIQSRQLLGYVDRGLQFYIDAANTASNLTTAIADISSNHYSVGVHNAVITPTAFQVRNFYGQTSTQCIVTQFDNGILKSTNKPGTWTLEAYWKNISPPCSGEAFIVGRIGCHGGIYCYDYGGGYTEIRHAIKTAACWTGAYNELITVVAPGETVHSVMTYNDGWIRSYINGILIKTYQWDYNTYGMENYSNDIRIGGWDNDSFPQYGTNSDIYAIRCYSTELTQQEVAQNYQHIIQQSHANNGVRIREAAPIIGSLSFNGTNQKLTLPASEDWNLGLGDFTIEWFQYMTSPNGSVFDITVSDQYWQVVLAVYFNANTVFVQQPNGSGNGVNLNSVIPEYINVWVHFAVVRHSGYIRLYANGELALSIPDDGINISGANSQLTVGGVSGTRLGLTNFPGKITNFRLVKGTAIYTTWPFTAPTAPLEAVANTKLLLLTEPKNPLKDSSGLDKQVTNVGNTPWDSSTPF